MPEGVVVDVDIDWMASYDMPAPICSACGIEMVPIEKDRKPK